MTFIVRMSSRHSSIHTGPVSQREDQPFSNQNNTCLLPLEKVLRLNFENGKENSEMKTYLMI